MQELISYFSVEIDLLATIAAVVVQSVVDLQCTFQNKVHARQRRRIPELFP